MIQHLGKDLLPLPHHNEIHGFLLIEGEGRKRRGVGAAQPDPGLRACRLHRVGQPAALIYRAGDRRETDHIRPVLQYALHRLDIAQRECICIEDAYRISFFLNSRGQVGEAERGAHGGLGDVPDPGLIVRDHEEDLRG